ncbi:MAG: DUF4339 domain-containing protein [Verrucomicrobiota bacterium]
MAYYVLHNDHQEGPLEADQIKSRVAEGGLSWTDLCWREGWRQWRPIGSVAALAPPEAFAPAPENPLSGVEEDYQRNFARQNHASWSWVIVLAVLLMLAIAGIVVLSIFLSESRERITQLEQSAGRLANLESATVSKILEARAPVPGNEIKIWATFHDSLSTRPTPVSRANTLLYRAESVADALKALKNITPGSTGSLLAVVQEKLPPPWRETITDSDGIAVFTETPPGDYVLVVFTVKSTGAGDAPYLWMAAQNLDGQPHSTLVLTEENATREGSALQFIEP